MGLSGSIGSLKLAESAARWSIRSSRRRPAGR